MSENVGIFIALFFSKISEKAMRRDDRRWPLTSLGSYVPLNIPGKLVRVLYEIVFG